MAAPDTKLPRKDEDGIAMGLPPSRTDYYEDDPRNAPPWEVSLDGNEEEEFYPGDDEYDLGSDSEGCWCCNNCTQS